MKYAVRNKTHVFDFLYPYIAKLMGMKSLNINDNPAFDVVYYINKFCTDGDTADTSLHKLTVECDFGFGRNAYIIPSLLPGHVSEYQYDIFCGQDHAATIGPVEWELIRPKAYCNMTEYCQEISSAVNAYQFLHKNKCCEPFIIEYYRDVVSLFRQTLIEKHAELPGDDMTCAVSFSFNSDSIYGEPTHQNVMVSRTMDNRLMLSTASLN